MAWRVKVSQEKGRGEGRDDPAIVDFFWEMRVWLCDGRGDPQTWVRAALYACGGRISGTVKGETVIFR